MINKEKMFKLENDWTKAEKLVNQLNVIMNGYFNAVSLIEVDQMKGPDGNYLFGNTSLIANENKKWYEQKLAEGINKLIIDYVISEDEKEKDD